MEVRVYHEFQSQICIDHHQPGLTGSRRWNFCASLCGCSHAIVKRLGRQILLAGNPGPITDRTVGLTSL